MTPWSTLEWLCNRTQARLLFATHYHELTSLAGKLPCLANTHMAVAGDQDPRGTKLRFLYQMREGATNDSFGIQVARLAGLPAPVIERSWAILEELENGKKSGIATPSHPDQMGLFEFATLARTQAAALPEVPAPVLEPTPTPAPAWVLELESTPIDSMTPLQALNFLARLQETARGSTAASV